jgi:hypothetical protein
MWKETIWMDTQNATSSPGSADGRSRCEWQDGQQMFLFGREAAHVSHSVHQGNGKAQTTSVTYGQSSTASSRTAALQSCLESKLRARMDGIGSPLYAIKWKHWDMQSGPPICALRASVRRTSGNDCSGWPTPMAGTPARNGNNEAGSTDSSRKTVAMVAGYATPTASDKIRSAKFQKGRELSGREAFAGWVTPKATDGSKGGPNQTGGTLPQQAHGATSNTSHVETGKSGQLDPAFSCWLMGYPAEWLSCVDWATPLSRKSLRNS